MIFKNFKSCYEFNNLNVTQFCKRKLIDLNLLLSAVSNIIQTKQKIINA